MLLLFLKEGRYGLHSAGSGYGPVVGSSEHKKFPLPSIWGKVGFSKKLHGLLALDDGLGKTSVRFHLLLS